MDKSNKAILCPIDDETQSFLTDLVPDDNAERQKKNKKEKRQNWDTRKLDTVQVGDILSTGAPHHQRQANRIKSCAEMLIYLWSRSDVNGEILWQFFKTWFCRVRFCPICQWRRSQMWVARFFNTLPRIYAAYPTMRYVLLTLTIANCPTLELRSTVQQMNKAWQRLSQRKAFPALGFIRSLEVTKETDTYDKKTKKLIRKARPNYCHPHFHIILALPASYFGGYSYLSTAKWAELWKDALRIDYTPICDVRIVKPKKSFLDALDNQFEAIAGHIQTVPTHSLTIELQAILKHALRACSRKDATALHIHLSEFLAVSTTMFPELQAAATLAQKLAFDSTVGALQASILETIKYTVKPSDMVQDRTWTLTLVDQLHNSRAIALGGIFKEFLKEDEEERQGEEEEINEENTNSAYFGWRQPVQRYQRLSSND